MTDIDVLGGGADAIAEANLRFGLALAPDEIEYLVVGTSSAPAATRPTSS